MNAIDQAKLEMITRAIEANVKVGRVFKKSKKDILDFGGNTLSETMRYKLLKNC